MYGYYNPIIKYANSIEDVKKEFVYGDTPYFSTDLSVLWIKKLSGDIKSYELKEIVQKDEKDLIIDSLQLQINNLKEELENAKSNSINDDESIKSEESSSISNVKSKSK